MDRQSFVERYQVPQMLWGGFLLIAFIALASGYIDLIIEPGTSEFEVGGVNLLQISAPARAAFKLLGPILFITAIGIHVPVFPIQSDGTKEVGVPVIECEGLAAGEDPPQAGYVLVDFSHGQDDWYDYSAGVRAVVPVFCRPRASLAVPGVLKGASVAVMALSKVDHFDAAEIDAVVEWVERGGRLLLLGYYVWTHHDTNVNKLAQRLGFEFADNLVLPGSAVEGDTARQVFGKDADLPVWFHEDDLPAHPLFSRVGEVALQSGATIRLQSNLQPELALRPGGDCSIWEPNGEIQPDGVRRVAQPYTKTAAGSDPILVAFRRGRGRVLAVGTWKVFAFDLADNQQLMRNAIEWLQE